MPERNVPALPNIGMGMDLKAMFDVRMKHILAAMMSGSIGTIDHDAEWAEITKLPHSPDERLR